MLKKASSMSDVANRAVGGPRHLVRAEVGGDHRDPERCGHQHQQDGNDREEGQRTLLTDQTCDRSQDPEAVTECAELALRPNRTVTVGSFDTVHWHHEGEGVHRELGLDFETTRKGRKCSTNRSGERLKAREHVGGRLAEEPLTIRVSTRFPNSWPRREWSEICNTRR